MSRSACAGSPQPAPGSLFRSADSVARQSATHVPPLRPFAIGKDSVCVLAAGSLRLRRNRALMVGIDRSTPFMSIGRRPPGACTPLREFPALLSRLRNSWGFRLGAVLNSPGEHPFALDRRLDAGSGGPAARREVEVGLFRRVADRAPGHGWVTDAHRAPKGRCRRCAGYVTRRTSWSAVSASTPNMQ